MVRLINNYDVCSKGSTIYKNTLRVKEKGVRYLHLSNCNLTDFTFPNIFNGQFNHITRLDIGFNNLQNLPQEIGDVLVNLTELWANDNPLLVSVPVSLSKLKHLKVIDLRNTAIFNIPREYVSYFTILKCR